MPPKIKEFLTKKNSILVFVVLVFSGLVVWSLLSISNIATPYEETSDYEDTYGEEEELELEPAEEEAEQETLPKNSTIQNQSEQTAPNPNKE